MKIITNFFLLLIATFFISCGEDTNAPIITDVSKIEINERTPTLYSTDSSIALSASVTYADNTTATVTQDLYWQSSNTDVASVSDGVTRIGYQNGGDANISITYSQMSDFVPLRVIALTDFAITNEDINATGSYILEAKGTFEDGTMDKVIVKNIVWTADNSATISVVDDVWTLTILAGETNVTATVFGETNTSSPLAPRVKTYILN